MQRELDYGFLGIMSDYKKWFSIRFDSLHLREIPTPLSILEENTWMMKHGYQI